MFENLPFFDVFFKCDDTFEPKPPLHISMLITKLIKQKLPHFVVQKTFPETELLKRYKDKAIVYASVKNNEHEVFRLISPEEYLSLRKEGQGKITLLCLQRYEEKIDIEAVIVEYLTFYFF